MAVEEFQIDFSRWQVHECGAALIALLAYPGNGDEEYPRSRLHASLCAQALRIQFAGTPEEQELQTMRPIHAMRDRDEIAKDVKTLERRFRDRMVAARMAIGFLQLASGTRPKLPVGVDRLSLNQMARMVLKDSGQSVSGNVKTRTWRPSLPVIHLAAATAVVLNDVERAGLGQCDCRHIISNRPLIEAIVRTAQSYEALMSQSRHFPKSPKNFVRFRIRGE